MAPAVVFDGVSKKFRRGEAHTTLFALIPAMAGRLLGRNGRTDAVEFWALRDVSFEVNRGGRSASSVRTARASRRP